MLNNRTPGLYDDYKRDNDFFFPIRSRISNMEQLGYRRQNFYEE